MGGRGTYAAGNDVEYTYQTVDKIEGVKVLEGLNGKHGLPEESHNSNAYIKLKPNGTFHEMRIYDKDHYLIKEIAYHPERDNFKCRSTRLITKEEYEIYKKYLKGVIQIDTW